MLVKTYQVVEVVPLQNCPERNGTTLMLKYLNLQSLTAFSLFLFSLWGGLHSASGHLENAFSLYVLSCFFLLECLFLYNFSSHFFLFSPFNLRQLSKMMIINLAKTNYKLKK